MWLDKPNRLAYIVGMMNNTNHSDVAELTIRIASAPCGASDAFMHPACCGGNLIGVEFHDMTIVELLQQDIIICDSCGERIVPKGVSLSGPKGMA